MRVIGGTLKGRRLVAPGGRSIRPTADRVREALFSILADRVAGARVLDLFAGTGALAIEALSRGADDAVLVDSSREAVRAIERNLDAMALSDRARVVRSDVWRFLDLGPSTGAFDLIFADPPYTIGAASGGRILSGVVTGGWMAPRATVVTEHDPKTLWDVPQGLVSVSHRDYGGTRISIYAQEEEPSRRP